MVAGACSRGDHHLLTRRPDHRAVGEAAEPDLRALQVGEHADHAAALGGDLAHHAVERGVFGAGAVAEVESRHVHSGVDEFGQRGAVAVAGPSVQTIFARRFMLLLSQRRAG